MSRLIIVDSIFKIEIQLSSVQSYEIAEENYDDPIEVEHQLRHILSSNDEIVINVDDKKIAKMFTDWIKVIDHETRRKHNIITTKEKIKVDGDMRDEVLIVQRKDKKKDEKLRFYYIYTEPYY